MSQTLLVVYPISRLSFLANRTLLVQSNNRLSPSGRSMVGLSQPGYSVSHFPAFLVARVAMWPCPGQWDISRSLLRALLIRKRQMWLSPSLLPSSCLKCECGAWTISGHRVTMKWHTTNLWMVPRKKRKRLDSWYCYWDAVIVVLPVSGFLIWWKPKTNPSVYTACSQGFFSWKHL